jgi:nuclear pore complex protein Nup98-Nup96
MDAQLQQSAIRLIDGVPFARIANIDFQQFIQLPAEPSMADFFETLTWQLTNILLNDELEDDISAGVPPQLRNKYIHRIKKDRLSRLWESILHERHAKYVDKIQNLEERAVVLLSCHRIEEACKTLVEGGNPHLATLVAQIGRDQTIRIDMQNQVESWRQHNVYSEMSEPIRALYELLAGNALRSEGKPSGALEDRASTFSMSERFDLDWFQAFGLRLWYSIADDEPIEDAVFKFHHDLIHENEPAFPKPWRVGESHGNPNDTSDVSKLESALWIILKLYAMITSNKAADAGLSKIEFPAALLPTAVSGNPLKHRPTFQLHQVITTIVGPHDSLIVDSARADQLVWDYCAELIAADQLEKSVFVALHLSRAIDRERLIKEILASFASKLPNQLNTNGDTNAVWLYLTNTLQLPEVWIWVAKALHARAIGDAVNEVYYLIRGKNWNEAHSTFCRTVGPRMIIQRDHGTLQKLVAGFGDSPERKVRGWTSGAGMYDDFLQLVQMKGARLDHSRLKKLVLALVEMGKKINRTSNTEALEERVALMEMSGIVSGWCLNDETNVRCLCRPCYHET